MSARTLRRNSSGHLNPLTARLRRYEPVLRSLGLSELFSALPRISREDLIRHKFPDPVLEFDETYPAGKEYRALRKPLEAGFAAAHLLLPTGLPVTAVDFFSVMAGLNYFAFGVKDLRGLPESCVKFIETAREQLKECCQPLVQQALSAWYPTTIVPLIAGSRVDERMLTVTVRQDHTPSGKLATRLIVGSTPAQTRQISLDGSPRAMFRVGSSNGWGSVTWADWEGKPVWAQSHALRQLRERINLPSHAPYLDHWLYESLRVPKVVEDYGADLLVEYQVNGSRLGYLIVTPLKDVVAVRTFKFLTMQGTPEARKLEKKMRLNRQEVDWLRLHELATFTGTDLRDDELLTTMLEECGCGHLFELAEQDFSPEPKPFAAELRKYLRLAA